MNVDENVFFREATLLICGRLEIEEAMSSFVGYLDQFMPASAIFLMLYDSDYGAMRTIAEATIDNGRKTDRITTLPQAGRDYMVNMASLIKQEKRHPVIVVNQPENDPVSRTMVEDHDTPDTSLLIMWLAIEGNFIGIVVIECNGKDQYNNDHAGLLALLTEPFTTAVLNHLKHQEVLTLKERLLDDNRYLHREMKRIIGENIIGENFGLKNVMEMVRQVAPLDSPVLLLGETGVGKDVIANAIQNASTRAGGPFVTVNCGAIPETLLDSELFGHEKGAFTGALTQKRGLFERADRGTIFLDEIGELPPQAQVRLLRVLQNHEIERVGGTAAIKVDIRIIAATNRNLEEMIKSNTFREDLWFRLNVFPMLIPPLRDRKMDIPSLVQHFIDRKTRTLNRKEYPVLAPGAIDTLVDYHWPGNVRELENIIERALILNRGEPLSFHHLLNPASTREIPFSLPRSEKFLKMDEMIIEHIKRALEMAQGRIQGSGGAAELLDMNPNTLRSRMRKLGILC